MNCVRRHWLLMLLLSLISTAIVLVAFIPVQYDSKEEVFEIPAGTWARRMTGEKVEILPQAVYLALGVRNVLVLRNLDTVPQMFGPTLIMPQQSFSLPFDLASEYEFACTAHLNGQMKVIVNSEPTPGWQRLIWRLTKLTRNLKVKRTTIA
ncbi:MAG TPA: hypothetical protein VIZ65_08890 [Cellvibrionaceae bacterium]